MAAGLRPDPLGELKRSPDLLVAVKEGLGPPGRGRGKGRGRKERRGEGREGKGRGRGDGKGWEGRGDRKGREEVHNLRKTTPRR